MTTTISKDLIQDAVDAIKAQNTFVSEELTVGVGTQTIAHGLPSAPTKCYITAVCKTAEHEYVVGEKIFLGSLVAAEKESNNLGIAVSYDDTHIYVAQSTISFFILEKSTGFATNVTAANWRLIVTVEL